MVNKKPTVISIFAGCGGSSLGYKAAGFKELLAIDFDKNCENTFNKNFPKTPFWCKDIGEVTVAQIMKQTGLKKGELDILDGSPPCQGFSMAGDRKVNDPRNDLFIQFVRILEGLQPKAFLIENVGGLIQGAMKGRYLEILTALNKTGYQYHARLINAANYGVPQIRRRIIIIGARPKLELSPFPEKAKEIVSIQKAMIGVKNKTFHHLKPDAKMFKVWQETELGKSGGTRHTRSGFFNWRRPLSTRPSPTITAFSCMYHWAEPRLLTIEECKRIMTFPDDFEMTGSFSNQWRQLGNAVPPELIKRIASQIATTTLQGRNLAKPTPSASKARQGRSKGVKTRNQAEAYA